MRFGLESYKFRILSASRQYAVLASGPPLAAWKKPAGAFQGLLARLVQVQEVQRAANANRCSRTCKQCSRPTAPGVPDRTSGSAKVYCACDTLIVRVSRPSTKVPQKAGKVPKTAFCWSSQDLLMGFSATLHGLPRRARNIGKHKVWKA